MRPSLWRQAPAFRQCRTRSLPAMTRIESQGIFSRTAGSVDDRSHLDLGRLAQIHSRPAKGRGQAPGEESRGQAHTNSGRRPGQAQGSTNALRRSGSAGKVATLNLKNSGSVNVDKGKEQGVATVNILKTMGKTTRTRSRLLKILVSGLLPCIHRHHHRPLTRAAESRASVSLFRTAPKDR